MAEAPASVGDKADTLSRKQKKKQKQREKKRQQKQEDELAVVESGDNNQPVTNRAEEAPVTESGSQVGGTKVESEVKSNSKTPSTTPERPPPLEGKVEYVEYVDERQLPEIMSLVDKDLSEPYSIFTYRFFVHNWPKLCVCAMLNGELIGVIICKAEHEPDGLGEECYCGYIAMLAVNEKCRGRGVGTELIKEALKRMVEMKCDQAMLETEVSNKKALQLYERLGFLRDERLFRYYLNGSDAFRLRLWFDDMKPKDTPQEEPEELTSTREQQPTK